MIVAVSRVGRADEYHVTVKLQLLQAYARAIFELQQQIVHYRALVDNLLPKSTEPEDQRQGWPTLNAPSVALLDSIVSVRASTPQFCGYNEPDEG